MSTFITICLYYGLVFRKDKELGFREREFSGVHIYNITKHTSIYSEIYRVIHKWLINLKDVKENAPKKSLCEDFLIRLGLWRHLMSRSFSQGTVTTCDF